MADNVDITPGTGATVAADEIGGVKYQRVKISQGADGAAVDVSSAAPLNVTLANGTVPSHEVTNAGTFAVQAVATGAAAHDATVSGNPVLIGGVSGNTAPSAVSADGEAVRAWMMRNGATVVNLSSSGTLIPGDGTNGLDVDVTRSALPTGASTSANQTTIIGHLDGVESILTTMDADTGALAALIGSTALTGSDNALAVRIHPDGVNANGSATSANSAPTVPASDWVGSVALGNFGAGKYETVAASQSDQVLGATGAVGDYLAGLLVIPATTSPGNVLIQDGNGSDITVFAGGASSVSNLVPFFIPIQAKTVNATSAGWKVTTGSNVSVFATGNFT